jgi:starch synthase (maltosyl-transferring)
MKPIEGRRRVIIEAIQPQIDGGRYPAKRTVGDNVTVTAAIFSDGHDHVAARLLYSHSSDGTWNTVRFEELNNDLWTATFPVDRMGTWKFKIEAWVDHFDTWSSDLTKRLGAQPDPNNPSPNSIPQDIPLALRIGANLLDAAAERARGEDAAKLKAAAAELRALADQDLPYYARYPVSDEIIALADSYPDLRFASRSDRELELWVDRDRARYSSWYELFPRSAANAEGVHGSFKDVEKRLPSIAAMGFHIPSATPSARDATTQSPH